MPTREEIPDSVERNLFGGTIGPIELDNYLPGSSVGADVGLVAPSLPEIISDVESLESVAGELESAITSDLVSNYQEIASTVTELQSVIIGDILLGLEEMDGLRAKLSSKIIDGIASSLDHMYGLMASLGFHPPSDSAVKYGLATGDYVGSMTNYEESQQTAGMELLTGATGNDVPTGGNVHPENEIPHGPGGAWNYCPVGAYLQGLTLEGSIANFFTDADMGECCLPFASPVPPLWSISGFPPEGRYNEVTVSWAMPSPIAFDPYGNGIFYYPESMILALNWTNGNVRAVTTLVSPWVEYPCYIKMRVIDHNGNTLPPTEPPQPPSQPPLPPQPPQPPLPPVDDEITKCLVDAWNCGQPAKLPTIPNHQREEEFCKQIEQWMQNLPSADSIDFTKIFSMQWNAPEKDGLASKILQAITGGKVPAVSDFVNRFGQWVQVAYQEMSKSLGCDNVKLAPAQGVLSFLRLFQQYIPIVPQVTMEAQTQIVNTICQSKIPNGSEANAAFLADVIDKETWRCWQKANGNYTTEQNKIVEAMRTRIDPFHASKLYRQKLFGPETFKLLMRQAGVLNDEDRELIHETTRMWPSISDVTRFLVRDVADDTLVEKYGMDDDFKDKWKGDLIHFADAIGVSEELGKYYWRAHWHIPSFTQLKEMAARLRPGRVDKEVETSYDDMYNALKQDDWLPFWAKRMMAIGRPVVPKSEVVKAYNLHAIEEKELLERFLDLGYTQKDAEFYVDYHKAWRTRDERKKAGWPSLTALTKQYASCLITIDQFKETLANLAMSDEQVNEAVDAANLAYDVEFRRVTIQGIMYQYRRGLINEAEANAALSKAGVPAGCVPTLVQRWTAQKQRQPKHLQAAALCKMRSYGIITAEQQASALALGGWNVEDATRITEVCTMQLTEQQAKEALKAAEKARREYERQLKEEAKRRKEELCGKPPCPKNTPGGQSEPPVVP